MSSRFRFISAHRATFGVKRLCRVLAVSRSGFYCWSASEPARQARAADEDALAEQIKVIHADSGGTYGSPSGDRQAARPWCAGQPQAGRADHAAARRGRPASAPPQTHHRPGSGGRAGAGPIRRDFTATAPDQRWCGDITYLRVGAGWLYLATVIDIATRRLIGWSINTHMRTALVIDALHAAVAARCGRVDGVIFHSDRGAQYGSADFANACQRHGIRPSMGPIGSSYDNALAEAFFATL